MGACTNDISTQGWRLRDIFTVNSDKGQKFRKFSLRHLCMAPRREGIHIPFGKLTLTGRHLYYHLQRALLFSTYHESSSCTFPPKGKIGRRRRLTGSPLFHFVSPPHSGIETLRPSGGRTDWMHLFSHAMSDPCKVFQTESNCSKAAQLPRGIL